MCKNVYLENAITLSLWKCTDWVLFSGSVQTMLSIQCTLRPGPGRLTYWRLDASQLCRYMTRSSPFWGSLATLTAANTPRSGAAPHRGSCRQADSASAGRPIGCSALVIPRECAPVLDDSELGVLPSLTMNGRL